MKLKISTILKHLVSQAKLNEAFELLLTFNKSNRNIDSDLCDRILLIASKYKSLTNNYIKKSISNSEINIETNRLVHSLLTLLDDIERETSLEQQEIIIDKDLESEFSSYLDIRSTIKEKEIFIKNLIKRKIKIKIAFLSANPKNENPLRLEKEMRDIGDEIIRSEYRDLFDLKKFTAVRVKDLQDCLLNYTPHFVHFSGHGNTQGIALLDNQTDRLHLVQSEPLANLFKLFSNDIACVFLNSCFSKEQGEQIRKYIPYVIGMKHKIPDETAIEFATVFYKGICAGREIDFSFELAKNSIDLNNVLGSEIPIII